MPERPDPFAAGSIIVQVRKESGRLQLTHALVTVCAGVDEAGLIVLLFRRTGAVHHIRG
jgi:hypothetical protein